MAETKIITNSPSSNKQRRNKFVVTGGVGGIAGVLIIGGVIGIVSLYRRNRAAKKAQDEIKISNGEEDEALPSLAPITEEEAEVKVEKQIFNANEPVHKSLWTSDIIEIIKDGDDSENCANSDGISSIIGDKDLPDKETEIGISCIIGDEDLTDKEIEMPEIISEENSPLPLEEDIHFVYEDDEDESEETETEREGSEDTSMDSNSEAIWPAESIEFLTKDGVLMKETNKETEIVEENDFQHLNYPISAKEFISRPSFFVWVALALALLYHFFAHYLPVVLSSK